MGQRGIWTSRPALCAADFAKARSYRSSASSCSGPGNTRKGQGGRISILRGRVDTPAMIELIWSVLVRAGNAEPDDECHRPALPEQALGSAPPANTLLHLALDPVRPLSSLMWGWIQDEGSRLTLARRAYEYHQEYGLTLAGKAVPTTELADRRGNFIRVLPQSAARVCQLLQAARQPDGQAGWVPAVEFHH